MPTEKDISWPHPPHRSVYSPALMRTLTKPSTLCHYTLTLWGSRGDAEQAAAHWNIPLLSAQFDDDLPPFTKMVGDPPLLELSRNGTTYYLAHFNHRTARYSTSPPPTEPAPRDRWLASVGDLGVSRRGGVMLGPDSMARRSVTAPIPTMRQASAYAPGPSNPLRANQRHARDLAGPPSPTADSRDHE